MNQNVHITNSSKMNAYCFNLFVFVKLIFYFNFQKAIKKTSINEECWMTLQNGNENFHY